MKKTTTCMMCGCEMREELRTVPFESLPGTRLIDVPVYVCVDKECDEEEVSLPRLEELIDVLARQLIGRPGRLEGAEIRFLRKSMGWSAKNFASKMQVDPSQVSRWERGKDPIGAQSNMLLRTMVVIERKIEDYTTATLAHASSRTRDDSFQPHAVFDRLAHWSGVNASAFVQA